MHRSAVRLSALAPLPLCLALAAGAAAQERLHYSYLWHMEQPIYWPDRQASGADRYELAWQSIQRKDAGATNPQNNLRDIFSLPDRVAGYQYRMRDSINAIRWTQEGGAQISFSGGLIENLNSLGAANQLGYSPTWTSWLREARTWRTQANQPRADIVQFGFHHPLMPLVDASTLRKELRLYRAVYDATWGVGAPQSRGLFPSEMAFSTRMIEVLDQEGIDWVIVSAEKISRAVSNFPVVYGTGGVNCDPPNPADQVNPAQSAWMRRTISRGCSPAEAAPFALTPRRARWVNPATGAVSSVIVVPASQSLSWEDGYAPLGLNSLTGLDTLAAPIAPNRPMLALLAHDGDNAWGGGFSYYLEATPNLASQAVPVGIVPTTVEEYLTDHPVPASDFVHVEDGAWVNADGDFGAPQFLNWNWPLITAQGQIDVENGWHVDARNWAVITAAQNRVDHAERLATRPGGPQPGGLDMLRILNPGATATAAERAWHYFLGSLNSGYMYYGSAIDMEVKPTVACNEALRLANPVIAAQASIDETPPTVWTLQRHPWNPGATNFGPAWGYQQRIGTPDFWVWTFVDDVNDVSSVTLKYRVDADGVRSLSNTENETYAGGPGVGAWQSITMTRRDFPAGNIFSDPDIAFTEMPVAIADQYHARITGLRGALVDYYVEALDTRGNLTRSPIHHVWVGTQEPSGGGGGGPAVTISPSTPVAGQPLTITYNPAGRPLETAQSICLHRGINTWTNVVSGEQLTRSGQNWTITFPVPSNATTLELVFNNCAGVWDNNGGADWRYTVTGGQPTPQWVMDGTLDTAAVQVAQSASGTTRLHAGLIGDTLYVASTPPTSAHDHFIFLAQSAQALRAAPWAKGGQVAGWDAFLAAEGSNAYAGWFDQAAGSGAQLARGAVLEGTINLRSELGLAPGAPLPEFIRLALGVYASPDAGALQTTLQAPAPTLANAAIEATEYALVRLCELTAGGCAPACDTIDFNNDGVFPDDQDISDFLAVLAGSPCPACNDLDFNNDGVFPDDADLTAFFRIIAGGAC